MKIAVVAPDLTMLGGNAVQAQALMDGLGSEGYEVALVPINPTFPPALRRLRRRRGLRTVVNQALYLPGLLRLRRADVAHIVSARGLSFVLASLPAILAARSFGKRAVLLNNQTLVLGGLIQDRVSKSNAGIPLLKDIPIIGWAFKSKDRQIQKTELLLLITPRVIRNIVDTSRFRYRERRILRPRLLSTRNLELYYRVDYTLEAFARVKARYPDATLTVGGFGSQEGRLRRLAGSLAVEGIRFIGRVEPEAMPRCYDDADIFLNSSVIDNQPVSVLEAFAAGLPVVSTVGDLAALVRDRETGLRVPTRDPGAMADAVVMLLEHPDFAAALARRARQEAERYTWARVRHEWAAVYSGRGGAPQAAGTEPGTRAPAV